MPSLQHPTGVTGKDKSIPPMLRVSYTRLNHMSSVLRNFTQLRRCHASVAKDQSLLLVSDYNLRQWNKGACSAKGSNQLPFKQPAHAIQVKRSQKHHIKDPTTNSITTNSPKDPTQDLFAPWVNRKKATLYAFGAYSTYQESSMWTSRFNNENSTRYFVLQVRIPS